MAQALESNTPACELLSPAGNPAAAYAAFHFGADAVYLGLKKFSARADAENFTADEFSKICAYAHQLVPRRRIYVALNTLIFSSEIKEVLDTLTLIAQCQADALIVQDPGVFHLAKRYFPELDLHASTQFGIRSAIGAKAAADAGFKRVVLARELSLEEISTISKQTNIELEVFVHGALCYSYSGLCLFSSLVTGKSANRGQCIQPCRELYQDSDALDSSHAPFFSMKDLESGELILKLRDIGVKSFKIEGRKKSPLYVAAATAFYRAILDGKIDNAEYCERQDELRTIFSRATTLGGLITTDSSPIETKHSGPRGCQAGQVESIVKIKDKSYLGFKTKRTIQLHDGLQVEIPGINRPFGFSIKELQIYCPEKRGYRSALQATAGSNVRVALPPHYPRIEIGQIIACSASQQVAKRYAHPLPQLRNLRVRIPLKVKIEFSQLEVKVEGKAAGSSCCVQREACLVAARSDNLDYRVIFEKLAESAFELVDFEIENPKGLFCPAALLKGLKKELCHSLMKLIDQRQTADIEIIRNEIERKAATVSKCSLTAKQGWLVKSDDPELLVQIAARYCSELSEVVLQIDGLTPDRLNSFEKALEDFPRISVRYALPPILRNGDQKRITPLIRHLLDRQRIYWEIASLESLAALRQEAEKTASTLDLSADWPFYVTNPAAVIELAGLGIKRATISPEDQDSNIKELVSSFPGFFTLIAYQDTPLFISDFCSEQPCRKSRNYSIQNNPPKRIQDVRANNYLIFRDNCRSTVISDKPCRISGVLAQWLMKNDVSLRIDFTARRYTEDLAFNVIDGCLKKQY